MNAGCALNAVKFLAPCRPQLEQDYTVGRVLGAPLLAPPVNCQYRIEQPCLGSLPPLPARRRRCRVTPLPQGASRCWPAAAAAAGKGAFGVVRLVVETKTGRPYACKSISKAKLISKEDVEDVRREVEILNLVSPHPTVAGLKQVVGRCGSAGRAAACGARVWLGAAAPLPLRQLRPARMGVDHTFRHVVRAPSRLPTAMDDTFDWPDLPLRVAQPVVPVDSQPPPTYPPTHSCLAVGHPPVQVYEDRYAVHIVMEVCVGGELFERIVSKGTFSEAEAARHFRKMVEMVGAGGYASEL